MAQAAKNLTDAEIKGRELARQLVGLYEQRPATNYVQTCVLKIRPARNQTVEFSLRSTVSLTPTNWQQVCETIRTNSDGFTDGNYLRIIHDDGWENEYLWNNHSYNGARINPARSDSAEAHWSGTAWVHPFSGSDFWAVDLGLEFFHWPEQKVLPNTTNLKRGRAYTLLESTNPNPSTNGYSRVLSWIDTETGGILEAEAYDAQGKLLKEFEPKSFKKVNGQWELQEMEIRNVQTGSRTRLEFDLKKE